MTELKLQPITGPGEYTQRNGKMAEIVGQDKDGNWLGWVVWDGAVRGLNAWKSSGEDPDGYGGADIVQPKPEIEIPEDLFRIAKDAWRGGTVDDGVLGVCRVAIAWDRAARPKREPTAAEIMECYRKCYGGTPEVHSDGFRDAIRRAFELAQEPK